MSLEAPTSPAIEAIDPIEAMKEGTCVLKFGRHGRPGKRSLFLTEDGTAIMWYSKRKKADQSRIAVPSILRVVTGQQTDNFLRFGAKYKVHALRSLSIVYGTGRTLDVAFETDEDYSAWFAGLSRLVNQEASGWTEGPPPPRPNQPVAQVLSPVAIRVHWTVPSTVKPAKEAAMEGASPRAPEMQVLRCHLQRRRLPREAMSSEDWETVTDYLLPSNAAMSLQPDGSSSWNVSVEGLTANTAYVFRVRCLGGGGWSRWSAQSRAVSTPLERSGAIRRNRSFTGLAHGAGAASSAVGAGGELSRPRATTAMISPRVLGFPPMGAVGAGGSAALPEGAVITTPAAASFMASESMPPGATAAATAATTHVGSSAASSDGSVVSAPLSRALRGDLPSGSMFPRAAHRTGALTSSMSHNALSSLVASTGASPRPGLDLGGKG
eukprot:CAMPEP_0196790666 /NCGR_PEP_ID=MMETSP1104-20130614/28645_1 /TAXON_ID=33652 /ORGANISM="Cafeteria sp., Strain Caron Lab Isolate" /LENGTH=436 /DNA_ID=CAMNT_0042161033 /DNA_START=42 /DNA_END=1349 /DNA_ORIENTATION=-